MQNAGFKAVLIYNQDLEHGETIVRMSAHSMGNEVTAFAGFMSSTAGNNLHYLANLGTDEIPIVEIESKSTTEQSYETY